MTLHVGDHELVLDPYDYDFHEDPYPYYQQLRDEAPLYRNRAGKSSATQAASGPNMMPCPKLTATAIVIAMTRGSWV